MLKTEHKPLIGIAGILCLIFIIFSPALNNQFTYWDDNKYVIDNPAVRSLSGENIVKVFTDFLPVARLYSPLTILSYAVEYHFFQLNPQVYIRDNIILHLINTFLVFGFIYGLTKNLNISMIVMVLFGIHPMRVESVVWIPERKDLLYSLFFLSALLSYLKYYSKDYSRKWFGFTYLFFLLSLISKLAGVILPVVLLAVDDYLKKRPFKKCVPEKIPFFALSLLFGCLACVQKTPMTIDIYSALDRILFGSFSFVMYFVKAVVPFQLSAYYPYPEKVNGLYPYYYYMAPFLFVLLGGFAWIKVKANPYLRFGFLFYMSTIFLVLGFIPMSNAIMADHNTYIPYLGLFFMLACGLEYWMNKKQPLSLLSLPDVRWILIFYLAFLAVLTVERCRVWKDAQTLWTDVLMKSPRLTIGYISRGNAFALNREYDKAMNDYNQAITLDPYEFRTYINRGYLYYLNEQFARAIDDYNRSIAIYPKWPIAYLNRGLAYSKNGEVDSAIADYTTVLALSPNIAEAHEHRGELYMRKKEYGKAIEDFSRALQFDSQARIFFKRSLAFQAIRDYNNAFENAVKAKDMGYAFEDGEYLNKLKNRLKKN
ncbi:MAG: hypothetical protein A2Z88_10125 [Omnitrophica WOR_2 bacterium GWA2_47_8]|nr:MAG: hypothetical protein A2Z88_10125 [Omnitrophica WOR_2 bacterium GWA2_47_8]